MPPLTDQQMEIINGSLLGDGALGDNKGYTYEGQFRNSSFTKGQKAANLEYLDWLNTSLKPYSRNIGHGFSKKNGKLHPRVSLHTSNHKSLTELRKLWYPQGKKIVPKDIILTPLSVAIWFCDDGYNNSDVGYAEIATNGFSFDDTDCLTCALKRDLDVVAYTYKAKRNNKLGVIFYQPIIKIPAKSYLKFIEIISPYIIWNCMAYKIKIEDKIRLFRTNWAEQGQPRMKNGGRNYNSRKKITDADIPYIISLRKQGMYQSEIAKLYGICQGQISKYASNRIAGLQETGVARSAVIVSINEHPEWKPRHIKTELNRQGITVSDSLISLIKKQLKDNTYI